MPQAELIDSKEKLQELEEAAKEGFARAQFNLAVCYEQGKWVEQDMEKANNDLMAPVYKKLDDAIKAVGAAEGVIYIFDMARTPIPYVNEAQSINLTPKVKTQLGIK